MKYLWLFQVRSEIQTREQEQEAEMERLVSAPLEPIQEAIKEIVPIVSVYDNVYTYLF